MTNVRKDKRMMTLKTIGKLLHKRSKMKSQKQQFSHESFLNSIMNHCNHCLRNVDLFLLLSPSSICGTLDILCRRENIKKKKKNKGRKEKGLQLHMLIFLFNKCSRDTMCLSEHFYKYLQKVKHHKTLEWKCYIDYPHFQDKKTGQRKVICPKWHMW